MKALFLIVFFIFIFAPLTILADAEADIRKRCAKKWPTDFRQQLYCVNTEIKAYNKLYPEKNIGSSSKKKGTARKSSKPPKTELIAIVKKGQLDRCRGYMVQQLADGYMSNPKWEGGKADNGQEFVTLRGGITFGGKPVSAALQFSVDRKTRRFSLAALELDGISQTSELRFALFDKMCESVSKGSNKTKRDILTRLQNAFKNWGSVNAGLKLAVTWSDCKKAAAAIRDFGELLKIMQPITGAPGLEGVLNQSEKAALGLKFLTLYGETIQLVGKLQPMCGNDPEFLRAGKDLEALAAPQK